jgi:hypothetical protein
MSRIWVVPLQVIFQALRLLLLLLLVLCLVLLIVIIILIVVNDALNLDILIRHVVQVGLLLLLPIASHLTNYI